MEILRDIRNERRPYWRNSDYFSVMIYSAGMCNAGLENSNYEIISYIWEGYNANRIGWDQYFLWYPVPTILEMIMRMRRRDCVLRFCGLIYMLK